MLAPGVLLTRTTLRLKRLPEPASDVKSFEKADIRSVLVGPGPERTLPETFQLLAVRSVLDTGGLLKVMTVESKIRSP